MNGRRALLPRLHSHKPVRVVVLGLGCNDMKCRLNCEPGDASTYTGDVRTHILSWGSLVVADRCGYGCPDR